MTGVQTCALPISRTDDTILAFLPETIVESPHGDGVEFPGVDLAVKGASLRYGQPFCEHILQDSLGADKDFPTILAEIGRASCRERV